MEKKSPISSDWSLPIGLNEAELGLSYEGTFAIPKAELDPVAATEFLQT